MLKALELAKGENFDQLKALIGVTEFKREEKISKVKNIYQELGVLKLSQQKMEDYYAIAIQNLNGLNVDESRKIVLLDVANKMMQRKS